MKKYCQNVDFSFSKAFLLRSKAVENMLLVIYECPYLRVNFTCLYPTKLQKKISLSDKYTQREGKIFLTGIQALVRLPLIQKDLDIKNNLDTGGFISGYKDSPLAGYD